MARPARSTVALQDIVGLVKTPSEPKLWTTWKGRRLSYCDGHVVYLMPIPVYLRSIGRRGTCEDDVVKSFSEAIDARSHTSRFGSLEGPSLTRWPTSTLPNWRTPVSELDGEVLKSDGYAIDERIARA